MGLNIKNRRTQRLAKELSRITGQNMTAAVTEALQARIEGLRSEESSGLVERILEIGRECAAHLKEPFRSIEHGQMLYDDKGLPR